ncbi:MAG: hypothetical protein SGILL_009874, partial [Bacillariaceae sp.]
MLVHGKAVLLLLILPGRALAYAQGPKPRFPRPQRPNATALKQSSRPLFSKSPFLPRDQKEFQD